MKEVFLAAFAILADCKHADEIPRAYTPQTGSGFSATCGWTEWPSRVLGECSDAIFPGIPDFRGNWTGPGLKEGQLHHEFIEQCADRIVFIGGGVIHDCLHADGTLQNGVHDMPAAMLPHCLPGHAMHVAFKWGEDHCLRMYPFNIGVKATTRCLNPDGTLYLNYGGKEINMTRNPTRFIV